MVSIVEILEIYLLPQVADGFGASSVCNIAQLAFCNYVAGADENDMKNIKEQNELYQVGQDRIAVQCVFRILTCFTSFCEFTEDVNDCVLNFQYDMYICYF